MSLYGSIAASSNDIQSRLQQLGSQVDQLERDERFVRGKLGRGSFNKRCSELIKQVETQRSRINTMKETEVTSYQKEDLKENFDQLWYRINTLAPDRDRSSSRSSNTIENSPSPSRAPTQRRKSMYDDVVESDESEEEGEADNIKERSPRSRPVDAKTILVGKGKDTQPDEGPKQLAVYQTQPTIAVEVVQETPVIKKKENKKKVEKMDEKKVEEEIEEVREVEGNKFIVLADLTAEQPSDLTIKKGEIITVIQTRSDGWWTSKNEQGQQGLVPKTFLRHITVADEQRIRSSVRTEEKSKEKEIIEVKKEHTNVMKTDVLAPSPLIVRCLGDAYRTDQHLSMQCHLSPRLSTSHLQFHDLIWDWKLDKVSNIHTIRAKVDGKGTWNFVNRTDTANSSVEFAEFIVRSNYSSKDVLLLIEASVVKLKDDGGFEERSLGVLQLQLTDDKATPILANKTYTETLKSENIFDKTEGHRTPYKIIFKVIDVPNEIEGFVDSMPDLLVFNPMFVRLIYFYRRRAGTILCRDRNNSLSSEMVSDPLLALFPTIADQPDLMDLLRTLWLARFKHIKNKPEPDLAKEFFQIFMNTAFCIHKTAVMPEYQIFDQKGLTERQKVMNKCVDIFKEHKSGARFLLIHPCRPLNIFDYSMDLLGPHALD